MYQITEQFNPHHFIFYGHKPPMSAEKIAEECPVKVLKKFKYKWLANLYYFFCGPPSWEPCCRNDWLWKIEKL